MVRRNTSSHVGIREDRMQSPRVPITEVQFRDTGIVLLAYTDENTCSSHVGASMIRERLAPRTPRHMMKLDHQTRRDLGHSPMHLALRQDARQWLRVTPSGRDRRAGSVNRLAEFRGVMPSSSACCAAESPLRAAKT